MSAGEGTPKNFTKVAAGSEGKIAQRLKIMPRIANTHSWRLNEMTMRALTLVLADQDGNEGRQTFRGL